MNLKALYTGQVVEGIKCDLASGHVTMDTVEKSVQLNVHVCKVIIEGKNPSPMGKIFLELLVAEHANAKRAELGSLVLLQNQNNG